jgi:HrpA-like RNA helicase
VLKFNALTRENDLKLKIYYKFTSIIMEFNLPITPILPEIYNFLKDKDRGIILGKTGIGKSLGIPGYILKNTSVKCYVAVPNLATAKFLTLRQKKLNPNISANVGYADKFTKPPTNATLIYSTSSYIKEMFLEAIKESEQQEEVSKITILFIDEAHVTSVDNYLIIKLWEYFKTYKVNMRIPKLFLLSAQVDLNVYNQFQPNQIYNIEINSKAIAIEYNYRNYRVGDRERYIDLADAVAEKHRKMPLEPFLIFLPGKKEIRYLLKLLTNKKLNNVVYLEAHGDLDPEKLERVYLPVPTGQRKIILSTNMFESVVTIENVGLIVDSLLEKRRTSEEGNILETVEISKASADQRTGRTGRTNPGVCYRMCTQDKYEELLDYKPVDIYNAVIYDILVKLISLEFPAPDIISLFPSEIRKKIPASISTLKKLDMITDRNVTEVGLFYYNSGLSIRSAAILWWWIKSTSSNLYAGLVVALIINNASGGYLNYDWSQINVGELSKMQKSSRINQYKKQFFDQFKGQSELHTYMNVWLSLIKFRNINKSTDKQNQIRTWSETNSIKAKKLLFLDENINHIVRLLKYQFNTDIVEMLYDTNTTIYEIMPILKMIYSDKQFLLVDDYYTNLNVSNDRYKLNLELSVSEYTTKLPAKVISFEEYVDEKRRIYEIKFSVILDPLDTRSYDPNLNKVKYRIPRRMHKPEFVGVLATNYVNYPELNLQKIIGKLNLTPEVPEQNIIAVGQVFPINFQ